MTSCRSFVDAVGDQIMVVGADYRITMVNAAFVHATGLPEADIVGRKCHEVTHRSPQPCWAAGEGCPLAAVIGGASSVSVSHLHVDAEGHEQHVEIVGASVRDADGELVGMIETIRDVTERKSLEDALRQRNADLEAEHRKRDQFTSAVCHELRNILNVQGLYAQLLRREPGDEVQAHAERILDGAKRLARLTDDMQDAAAIESQRFSIRRATCDLSALVRLAAEDHQLAAQGHRITADLPGDAIAGEWDRARLRQVLDNLLSNAVKFSPAGSEVRVVVRREPERASVSVSDAGLGIPEARLPELFQPYSRAHAELPGVGLGLFLSRGIIEAHGGGLSAGSVEGRGSTFTFWLPLR
jgi:PAS domain S-box-containing protein